MKYYLCALILTKQNKMNRLFQVLSIVGLFIFSLLLTNCDKEENSATNNNTSSDNSFKIAYVKTDSLAEVYEYYNDLQTALMLEQEEAEADLSARYKALQTKSMKIQRDLQNRMITPTSAQSKQEKLQLDLQKWQQDQERYQFDMMEKSQNLTLEILDSIQNMIKIYNEKYNYSMVMASDTLGSNILFADQSLDITEDIVKALNKRYRKSMADQGEDIDEDNE
jgi:outer membrane protein